MSLLFLVFSREPNQFNEFLQWLLVGVECWVLCNENCWVGNQTVQVFGDAVALKSAYTDCFSEFPWETSCFQLQKVVILAYTALFCF